PQESGPGLPTVRKKRGTTVGIMLCTVPDRPIMRLGQLRSHRGGGGSHPILGLRQGTVMRAIQASTRQRIFLLGVLVALGGWAVGAHAYQDKTTKPGEPASKAQPRSRNDAVLKGQEKVAFEMRDKPWSQVLEWLTDKTGLPVIGGF